MGCFVNDGNEEVLIAIPKDGDPTKIQGPFNGSLIDRNFSPKEAEMIKAALAGAVQMIRDADHEKISRQYREGVLGPDPGFKWFIDTEK
jgi:hypothetical protein